MKFIDMGYPCFPVHDSFIVHYALVEELLEYMVKAYNEQVGLPAKVDGKEVFTYQGQSGEQWVDMADIEDLFIPGGEYRGYKIRKQEWHATRATRL